MVVKARDKTMIVSTSSMIVKAFLHFNLDPFYAGILHQEILKTFSIT